MSSTQFEPVGWAVTARFRRAGQVVCYWADSGLVLHNYASGVHITAAPLAMQLLDFFGAWHTPAELIAAFATYDAASLCAAMADLFEASLLECEALDPGGVRDDEGWAAWNPAAGFFHDATKNVRYRDVHGRSADELVGQDWRPKTYPDAPQISLPAAQATGAFPEILLARRTWRRFETGTPLALGDIATLLNLTFGVHRWFEIPGRGPLPFKTSPSGGACHPIEAYLLALRVDGLDAGGWYHYDPVAHRLAQLAPAANGTVADYLPTQEWYGDVGGIVFMAAVFRRTQARYRFARAYRNVLIEAGHLCQTFCLTSTWLGLAPFCTAAFADSRIDETLGLDGMAESVLYVAGVGTRPAGVDWALYPADFLRDR